MRVYLGADHRGFALKEKLKVYLNELGYEAEDLGNSIYDPVDDFPDFAFAVAKRVAAEKGSLGIVICGSSGGALMAANKIKGIRASNGISHIDVIHNRDHNDMNVMALAADTTSEEKARILVKLFLTTPFGGLDRCLRRIAKIASYENRD
jgi:ribose 5-phosphate isomerase B